MRLIPIILASKSPRRKELLNQIGVEFSVQHSSVKEDFSLKLEPVAFTKHWAREKARAVAKSHPDSLVVGADTIVVLEGKILGKPIDEKESFVMLKSLSGNTHEVITGVSIYCEKYEVDQTFNECTIVSFNTLSDSDINYYIKTYNPFDKAGSYGIQDWFSVNVHQIKGCFYNVMGFPLAAFYRHYRAISESLNSQ